MTGGSEGAVGSVVSTDGATAAVRALVERFPQAVSAAAVNRGQWRLDVTREALVDMVTFLKSEPSLAFDFLVDVTGLDHYGAEPRFRAVYVVRSMTLREDLVLKVAVPEEDGSEGDGGCWAPSVSGLFASALNLEREAYDMFGIHFRGHPNLTRIMMPEVFTDFPLRKDFPMEGRKSDREWAEWIIGRAQRLEGDGH